MMSMGAVLHRHRRDRRLRARRALQVDAEDRRLLCMVGAASISAFPAVQRLRQQVDGGRGGARGSTTSFVWLVLLFASAGVFHHAGIKIPFFAFFAHDSAFVARAQSRRQHAAGDGHRGGACASASAVFPGLLYGLLP